MPIGLMINVCALLIGGLLGAVFGKRITQSLKNTLNNVFGICAMAIGISLIVKLHTLPLVVLAVVLGTIIGELMNLENRVSAAVRNIAPHFMRSREADSEFVNTFCAVAVIFCCSGTGWYGVLTEGFSGDGSILLAKSILDFFTAIIFSTVLGNMVACLAVPQLMIYVILFALSKLVVPFVSSEMLADFSAVGGLIELATGMRIAGVKKDIKILDMVPAMILIFPISAVWRLLGG